MPKKNKLSLTLAPAFALALTLLATATYSGTASAYYLIYSPYVEYGETEIELYGQHAIDDNNALDGSQQFVLEVGKGITPKLFLEAKVIAQRAPQQDLKTEGLAIEGVYQLTEAGEYSWDAGLIGEVVYSKSRKELDEIEFGPTLAKQLGNKMLFTTNIIAEYEKREKKVEGGVNAQLKWRMQPSFEPAVELYSNEYTTVFGPVVMGKLKMQNTKFGYELGWLVGVNDNDADNTIKVKLELEF